jgi:hypothetical protein
MSGALCGFLCTVATFGARADAQCVAESDAGLVEGEHIRAADLDRWIVSGGRAEASRRATRLGERVVPALIEERRNPSFETRAWAATLLETLGKRSPGDAVQTNDSNVLIDVLCAYGSARDPETRSRQFSLS